MPSALRLYLRSSSTWMLVSGRKSRGARLAGRSRLTKTRDRMRTEMKSPARRGGALGGPGRRGGALHSPGEELLPLWGRRVGGQGPQGAGKGVAWQPVGEAGQGLVLWGSGLDVICVTWGGRREAASLHSWAREYLPVSKEPMHLLDYTQLYSP